jgi:hypothetical protein
MSRPRPAPIPIHRWSGALWGFVDGERLFDRFGRQAGWIEPVFDRSPDVFDLNGRFLGELFARHYVLRYALREEPLHRAPRVGHKHPGSARSRACPRSPDAARRLERRPALAAVSARPARALTEPRCRVTP